jgi:hypothetical protein
MSLYSLTVNDGTAVGDYSLTFEFTLPTQSSKGAAIFATLSEVEEVDVCVGEGRHKTCSEQDKNVIIAALGGGSVTPSLQTTVSSTPVPAALPLLASGLGLIGWVARRRKQKSAALAEACI